MEYALYKGEELISIGTIDELAKLRGVKPATIKFYGTPSHAKRNRNGLRLVKLEDD